QKYLDIGGNANIAEKVLASGVGPVTETRVPYTTTVSTTYSNRNSWCYTQDYQLKSTAKAAMSSKSAVKQLLMDYGALAVSYHEDSYYYNSTNNSYYNKYYNSTNHAVTLVGWDDNFSKNKFAPYTPKSNGAWLIKNSWGADSRNEGYFWISYEDAGLLTGNAYKFIMDQKTTDHTYSYDGNASTNYWYASNSITGANIFTAKYADETVREAGFYTMASNTKYTVYVYKNVTAGKPTSGTLVDKVSGTAKYPGYHTVKFSKDIFLTSGTKYSVVVKLSKSNTKVKMATCGTEDWGWLVLYNDYSAGESYLKNGSSWLDISGYYYGENVRIEAMTINRVPNTSLSISNPGTMIPGQSTSMGLSYRSNTTDRLYISSSDSSVVDVENNKYVAKKPGVATITVKCGDYKVTQTITVIPSTPTITSVKYASGTSLKVSWDKVSKASGYYVYRSTDEGVTWKKIATITKGSTTSYTDKDRSAGKRYQYMVKAYTTYKSKKYYSLRSQAVEGIMLKKTTVTAKSAGYDLVRVSWKAVKGADGYLISYRKKGTSNWDYWEVGSDLTSFTVTYLDYYTTYEFRVQPFCNANYYWKVDETTYEKMDFVEYLGPNSSTVTAKPVLSKPVMSGGNTYYEAEHGSEVNEVIWYKVEGAEYYEIWRATSSTGTYKLAGTVMQNDVQSVLEDGRYFWKKDE
ncbi:MAG: fibronectin type III domain-containing protein, partial [Erysipelotrichaceae bacterium]|nr:fibronectin type III domain-containing protein [Erysipelotrichaceae bacterium]